MPHKTRHYISRCRNHTFGENNLKCFKPFSVHVYQSLSEWIVCCYVYIKSFTVVNSVSTNLFKQQLKRFSPKQGVPLLQL